MRVIDRQDLEPPVSQPANCRDELLGIPVVPCLAGGDVPQRVNGHDPRAATAQDAAAFQRSLRSAVVEHAVEDVPRNLHLLREIRGGLYAKRALACHSGNKGVER
jgi:hypothetical protein